MQEKIQKDFNSNTLTFALTFCMRTPTPTLTPGYSNSSSALKCRRAKKRGGGLTLQDSYRHGVWILNCYVRFVIDSNPNISNIGVLKNKNFAHGRISLCNIVFCQTSFWLQYVVMISTEIIWKGYELLCTNLLYENNVKTLCCFRIILRLLRKQATVGVNRSIVQTVATGQTDTYDIRHRVTLSHILSTTMFDIA